MNATQESQKSPILKIIGCGCFSLVVLGLLAGGGIFWSIASVLKNNDPYRDSIAAVKRNPAAIAALGEPIKPGFLLSGNISINNGNGKADFTIPVSGPKGAGTIHVEGSKESGATGWIYEVWELKVAGQPDPIPLGD